jgi:hypothetical protein
VITDRDFIVLGSVVDQQARRPFDLRLARQIELLE